MALVLVLVTTGVLLTAGVAVVSVDFLDQVKSSWLCCW